MQNFFKQTKLVLGNFRSLTVSLVGTSITQIYALFPLCTQAREVLFHINIYLCEIKELLMPRGERKSYLKASKVADRSNSSEFVWRGKTRWVLPSLSAFNRCFHTSRAAPKEVVDNELSKESSSVSKTNNPYSTDGPRIRNFLTGFADAESCFYVRVSKKARMRTGWCVELVFTIRLHIKDLALLNTIAGFYGVGKVYTHENVEEASYVVNTVKGLEVIIDHFTKYPLLTQK